MKTVFQDDKKGVACDPCRKSHVKCDRVKPACGVCTRRGIQSRCYGAKSTPTASNIAFVSHADAQANQPLFPTQAPVNPGNIPHSVTSVPVDTSMGAYPSNSYSHYPQTTSVPSTFSQSSTHLSHSGSASHSPHLSPHSVSSPHSPHTNSPQAYQAPLSPHATSTPLSPHFPHGTSSPTFNTSPHGYTQVSSQSSFAPAVSQSVPDYYNPRSPSYPTSPTSTSFPQSPQFANTPNFSPSIFTSSGSILSPPIQMNYPTSPQQFVSNDTQSYSGNAPYFNTPDASIGTPGNVLQYSADAAFISNSEPGTFTFALESDGNVEESLVKFINPTSPAPLTNPFVYAFDHTPYTTGRPQSAQQPQQPQQPQQQPTNTPLSPNYAHLQQLRTMQQQQQQQQQQQLQVPPQALPPLSPPLQSGNSVVDKNTWWKEGQGQVEKTIHTNAHTPVTHPIHSNINNANTNIINNMNTDPTKSGISNTNNTLQQNDGTPSISNISISNATVPSAPFPNNAVPGAPVSNIAQYSPTNASPLSTTATAPPTTVPTPTTSATTATTSTPPTATTTSSPANSAFETGTKAHMTHPHHQGRNAPYASLHGSPSHDTAQGFSSHPSPLSDASPSPSQGHSPSVSVLSSSSSSASSPASSPITSFSPSPSPFPPAELASTQGNQSAFFGLESCSNNFRKLNVANYESDSSLPQSSSPHESNMTTYQTANTIVVETPLSNGTELLTETVQYMDDDVIEVPPMSDTIIEIDNLSRRNTTSTNMNRTQRSTATVAKSTYSNSNSKAHSTLTVTASNKRARSDSNSNSNISKLDRIPADDKEKDELIALLRSEVKRLERMTQYQFAPYNNPSFTQALSTSLWDANTGMLVECNRNFYNEYTPRYSTQLKSMTLSGQEGVVCTGALVPMLRAIVHTSYVFQPKAHGKGFIMMGTCRIIRGPNSHLVSMISWDA